MAICTPTSFESYFQSQPEGGRSLRLPRGRADKQQVLPARGGTSLQLEEE